MANCVNSVSLFTVVLVIGIVFSDALVYQEIAGYYRYKLFAEKKVNWLDAFKSCAAENSQLLYIDSTRELNFISAFIKRSGLKNLRHKDVAAWTSGTDVTSHGKFVWKSSGKEINKSYFGPGLSSGERCVYLRWHRSAWKEFLLESDKCLNRNYFICKRTY